MMIQAASLPLLKMDRYDVEFEYELYALTNSAIKELLSYLSQKENLSETEETVLSYCMCCMIPEPTIEDFDKENLYHSVEDLCPHEEHEEENEDDDFYDD